MKKFLILLSVLFTISLISYTQRIVPEKVPAPVKNAFAKKFPAATDVKYQMEKNNYEINFKDKGVITSVNYSIVGKWLETETSISESDLPQEVTAAINNDFSGFVISKVSKVETPDKPLIYEMDLKKDNQSYEAEFSAKGDVLKKKPLKNKKKD